VQVNYAAKQFFVPTLHVGVVAIGATLDGGVTHVSTQNQLPTEIRKSQKQRNGYDEKTTPQAPHCPFPPDRMAAPR